MRAISYFMQTKTPRRLVVTTRSKSASVMSAKGVGRSSTPALLKAMSSRPQAGDGAVQRVADLVAAGDIAGDGESRAAELFDLFCGRLRGLLVQVDGDDVGAVLGEGDGRRPPDARAGTGDECDLAREPAVAVRGHRGLLR